MTYTPASPALEKALAAIDRLNAEGHARKAANAPFIARCEKVRAANSVNISAHGMAGAGQMFGHIFGADVNKKLAAECLMACRKNRSRDCRRAAIRYLAEAAEYRRAFVARAVA